MPRGGARPGAGRKKKATKELQLANREIVLGHVSAESLRMMVDGIVAQAANGDARAFSAIAPYLLGAPTQEIEVTGVDGGPISIDLAERDRRLAALAEHARTRLERQRATQPE